MDNIPTNPQENSNQPIVFQMESKDPDCDSANPNSEIIPYPDQLDECQIVQNTVRDELLDEPAIPISDPKLQPKSDPKLQPNSEIGGISDQIVRSPCYIIYFMIILVSTTWNQGYWATVFVPIGAAWLEVEHRIYDTNEQSTILGNINLCYCFGAAFGSALGGFLSQHLGRHKTTLFEEIFRIFVVGMYMINVIWVCYITRFLDGTMAGITMTTAAIYCNDVLPAKYKTIGGLLCFIFIHFGLLMTAILGYAIGPYNLVKQWRLFIAWPLAILL